MMEEKRDEFRALRALREASHPYRCRCRVEIKARKMESNQEPWHVNNTNLMKKGRKSLLVEKVSKGKENKELECRKRKK